METGEKARNVVEQKKCKLVKVPIRKKKSHQKQHNQKSGSQDIKES